MLTIFRDLKTKMVDKLLFCLLLCSIFLLNAAEFQKDRQIFVKHFRDRKIDIKTVNTLQYDLRRSVLQHLKEIPENVRKDLEKRAENEYKNGRYPQLTAWDYLEYMRNGNRIKYESKIQQRTQRLSLLTVGHLLDEAHNLNSSLYVDEIFNGVWMILEDTTWSWPATMNRLPGPGEIYVDLGAGEMATQVAWMKLLMKNKFEQVQNSKINQRIDDELMRRIFLPYLNYDWYWNGLQHENATVNNWNIWINSNILKAAVYTINDQTMLNKIVWKSVQSVDVFVDNYTDDGGCEEGPLYWVEAGGRLIQYIFTLLQIDPQSLEYFTTQELIKSIGEYSWKLRIFGHSFVNFADSMPEIIYPPSMVYQYGKLFKDTTMQQYSSYLFNENQTLNYVVQNLDEFLSFIQVRKEILKFEPKAPLPGIVSLPDLQIATIRSKPQYNDSNLYLAGKMGNNYESHSHNDIGSFVLYQNDSPVLIDIGVGTYDSKTFGPERYSLFYTQSQNHNCPTINGFNQLAGKPHRSTDVSTVIAGDKTFVTLRGDLKEAYPEEAKIEYWRRIIYFERNVDEVKIQDFYKLKEYIAPHQLNFITASNMNLTRTATGLSMKNDKVHVSMQFDWRCFDFHTETLSLENDKHLTDVWGESVQKFTLTTKSTIQDVYSWLTYTFSTEK